MTVFAVVIASVASLRARSPGPEESEGAGTSITEAVDKDEVFGVSLGNELDLRLNIQPWRIVIAVDWVTFGAVVSPHVEYGVKVRSLRTKADR